MRDLAAKIRWRKRFDRNPAFIQLQDKVAVRDHAATWGLATADVLHCTDDPRTIPFADLPADYMIKANHGSGWNIICRDSQHYLFGDGRALAEELSSGADSRIRRSDALPLSERDVTAQCSHWLRSRYASAEWAYQHIPRRIVVEELLRPKHGAELMDYRFYTFGGEVKAINVGSARYRRDHLNVFVDPEWNIIDLSRYGEALPPQIPEKPEGLAEMVLAAGRLGSGINFVRVDLYETAKGVALGEVTIYPEAGLENTPTSCPRFNRWLGDQWHMSATQRCSFELWRLASRGRRLAAVTRAGLRQSTT